MHRCYRPSVVVTTLLLLVPALLRVQVSPAFQNATAAVTHPASDTTVTGTVWLALPGEAALEQKVSAI
jgi:hypothetical protein